MYFWICFGPTRADKSTGMSLHGHLHKKSFEVVNWECDVPASGQKGKVEFEKG